MGKGTRPMAKRSAAHKGLAKYSISDLQQVLDEKEAAVADLEAAREEILAELAVEGKTRHDISAFALDRF